MALPGLALGAGLPVASPGSLWQPVPEPARAAEKRSLPGQLSRESRAAGPLRVLAWAHRLPSQPQPPLWPILCRQRLLPDGEAASSLPSLGRLRLPRC